MDMWAFFTVTILSNFVLGHAQTRAPFNFDPYYKSKDQIERVMILMRSYHEEALRRNAELDHIKYIHENNAEYEQGFMMGEIIERYRKMVEHVKRPRDFKSDTVFEVLKSLELTQKLYFEVYHLVNMFHEIPTKYGRHIKKESLGYDPEYIKEALETLKHNEKKREKEKKRKMKLMKKMRELVLSGVISVDGGPRQLFSSPKPTRDWWPIEYGWEIDYKWRKK